MKPLETNQPPLPGTPYEIPNFLDLIHTSGWRIVPGSLRWEGPKGEEDPTGRIRPVVDIIEAEAKVEQEALA